MKVLLVDDHSLFREGLRLLLVRTGGSFDVYEAGTCAQAFEVVAEHNDIRLILLDLELPDMGGQAALVLLRERHPHIPVVVLSARDSRADVLEAINLGAMGFIPKSSDSMALAEALQLVLANGVYLPTAVLGANPAATAASAERRTAVGRELLREAGLSDRQIDVLALLVQGLPNKLIADRLGLAEPTIKTHVAACLRALNVRNRTQAVLAVGRLGARLA